MNWIPVTERLPEPDTYVLASDGERVRCNYYSSNKYARKPKPRWEEVDGRLAFREPTHWMPLPAPPTTNEDKP